MRNIIISIILFTSVFSVVVFANKQLETLCDSVIESCEKIENYIDSDNYKDAYDECVSLLNSLQKENFVSSIYVNHMDLDTITNQVVSTSLRLKCKEKCEALASIHVVKYSSSMLKELQKPNFKNIL